MSLKTLKKIIHGANIVTLEMDVKFMNQDQINVKIFNVVGL